MVMKLYGNMGCSFRVIFFWILAFLFRFYWYWNKCVIIFISSTGHRSFCHHFASIICCVSL